jgi:hypothetical protein
MAKNCSIVSNRRGLASRKEGEFPIELWNVYDRVCTNLPRSNNSTEGWHQAFAKRVSIVHPTINKLADKIRREQPQFEVEMVRIRQGCEPKPKKATYRNLDERIIRLVDAYPNVDLGEYFKGVAANMCM